MMLEEIIAVLFILAGVSSALAIYIERTIFKSAIALSITFTVVSLSLLLLNQPVVAILQLIVIVGGVSTYLVVAVASETKRKTWETNFRTLAILGILLMLAISYIIFPYVDTSNVSAVSIYGEFQQTLQQYAVAIYFIILLMFVAALGSAVTIKNSEAR